MDRFLSFKQTWYVTNVSPRQQGRLIKRRQFPKPILLYEGGRRLGFLASEIEEWMAARVAAARSAGADPPADEPVATTPTRAEGADRRNGHGQRAASQARRRPQPPPRPASAS